MVYRFQIELTHEYKSLCQYNGWKWSIYIGSNQIGVAVVRLPNAKQDRFKLFFDFIFNITNRNIRTQKIKQSKAKKKENEQQTVKTCRFNIDICL